AVASVEPEQLRRYPNASAAAFREAAAEVLGITPDMILTGNGSDDVLAFAIQTFCSPGDTLAYPNPTYSLYPVLAEIDDVKTAEVPGEKDWALPIDALVATKARAIFLANPNAPSGTFVSPQKIEVLCKRFSGVVLIDEAYVDFADDNCLPLLREYHNLVI